MGAEMTSDSIDSRVGKLEGMAIGVEAAMARLHSDNEKFERKQDEILDKLDKLIGERNMIVGVASALSGLAATIATLLFSHWKAP